MPIRTDEQLLDGTYGTTHPIQPNETITSERHRDIIESKASRYSIENPDSSTPEGQLILDNRAEQDAQNTRLDTLESTESDQDDRLDYLDGEVGTLNGEFQNLASQITDLTQRVITLESEIKPIYENFTDVWNNPTSTELEVQGTKLSFVLIRQSNGTYLPYLRNLGQDDINIWFRSTQKYEGSGNTDYSLNSSLLIAAGGISDKLDNDSYGLGYGTYPNYTRISIQINETGEFYIWEMQSSSRSGEPSTGVISSAIRRYF